jgi:replicative DNA helicase
MDLTQFYTWRDNVSSIQTLILRNLLQRDSFTRKVAPFLKREYFEEHHAAIFEYILQFVGKYNKIPSVDALRISIENDATEYNISPLSVIMEDMLIKDANEEEWLLDQTENFIKERALHLAIMESIEIIDGRHKNLTRHALPDILSKALSVSFDSNVGHDYIKDSEERFDYFQQVEERVPFDLQMMNKITMGGLPPKTINICMASTGAGKTLLMCHVAAAALIGGKNVLYITMEMAQEMIAKRIDSNLLNVNIKDVNNMEKSSFLSKINALINRTNGKLIVKEYPTGSAHVGHFRALMNELRMKRNFVPDLLLIDYMNICASSRIKAIGGTVNSYSYIKAIAEELRGLAVEFNVPLLTSTQTNRSGANDSDVDITNVSDSFGTSATADMMFALIRTDELDAINQVMIKQLKNRYSDMTEDRRFVLGIDRNKMRLYDLEDKAQTLIKDQMNSSGGYVSPTDSFGGSGGGSSGNDSASSTGISAKIQEKLQRIDKTKKGRFSNIKI